MKLPIPPPSAQSIDALLEILAPGSWVAAISSIPGSFSNSTYLIEVNSARWTKTRMVVRLYAEFGDYDRAEKARREFKTLELLQVHRIPAPQPLYLDDKGAYLGTPGIITSFISGHQIIAPKDSLTWVKRLAGMLTRIHSIPCSLEDSTYLLEANNEAAWFLRSGTVPESMRAHPAGVEVWSSMRDLLPKVRSISPTLVHIDYWSGNILWDQDQISAVLDWEEAAFGDPGIDVAYLRAELFLLGMEQMAEEFLKAYEAEIGHRVENLEFWELAAATRFMPDPEGIIPEWQALGFTGCRASQVKQNFDHFIASALHRAGL
jgi:aminoglycoside phosphotransferase (APT) family kinase protein